jgi:hypothetical protein
VGTTLVNAGHSGNVSTWLDLDSLFTKFESIKIYRKHSSKPFIFGELCCAEEKLPSVEGDKAAWIDAYDKIKNKYASVRAVAWLSRDLSGTAG